MNANIKHGDGVTRSLADALRRGIHDDLAVADCDSELIVAELRAVFARHDARAVVALRRAVS